MNISVPDAAFGHEPNAWENVPLPLHLSTLRRLLSSNIGMVFLAAINIAGEVNALIIVSQFSYGYKTNVALEFRSYVCADRYELYHAALPAACTTSLIVLFFLTTSITPPTTNYNSPYHFYIPLRCRT